jgi:hypothetical protein
MTQLDAGGSNEDTDFATVADIEVNHRAAAASLIWDDLSPSLVTPRLRVCAEPVPLF